MPWPKMVSKLEKTFLAYLLFQGLKWGSLKKGKNFQSHILRREDHLLAICPASQWPVWSSVK